MVCDSDFFGRFDSTTYGSVICNLHVLVVYYGRHDPGSHRLQHGERCGARARGCEAAAQGRGAPEGQLGDQMHHPVGDSHYYHDWRVDLETLRKLMARTKYVVVLSECSLFLLVPHFCVCSWLDARMTQLQ